MIDSRTKFRPAYGTEAKILNSEIHEGWIYVASDTGKIFIDSEGARKQIGGSGSGGTGSSNIVWGYGDEELGTIIKATDDASDGDPVYYFSVSAVGDGTLPDIDALILNSDGRFFRVTDNALSAEGFFTVELIAVSGGGSGGGGGGASQVDLSLTWSNIDLLGSTYIYGQDAKIIFYPHSDTDEVVSIIVTAIDKTGNNPDVVRQSRVYNDAPFEFNTNLLPASDSIDIQVTIQADHSTYNKGRGLTKTFANNKVLKMYLEKPSDFMIGIQTGAAQLSYMPHFTNLGTTENPVRIRYALDGGDAADNGVALAAANNEHKQYINIPKQNHGMHTVDLWLSVVINAVEYNSDKVTYEVPWVDMNDETPIIWTRKEIGTVINYESAVLEYMVYSSVAAQEGSSIEISLYHGNDLLNTEEVVYSATKWLTMDLTANYEVGNNTFTLQTGPASKEFSFYVTNEGARDLSLRHSEQLEMNFDALGRSSKEIKSSRNTWVSKCDPNVTFHEGPYSAILRNFNWYSNGWKNDNDGMGAYLSVTNGASVTIPMESITLKGGQSWSFEIRFRVRNAKKFATLVTEIPKYRYYDNNGIENAPGEEKTLDEIEAIGGTVMLDDDGNMEMNEANTTKKVVQTEKYIAMKYLTNSGLGFAIGTQEAYFSTAGQVVNVKYKENEIINITFVVDSNTNTLNIYLNGILSGVADLNAVSAFTMENIAFEINSQYCDFDLYRFRVYPIALSLPDVIHNYIADIKDLTLYDENQLTDINDDTVLSYQELLKYNRDHPDDPTMPYMVIDMSNNDNFDLPCYKGDKKKVRIEFTNPVGDYLVSLPSDNTKRITPFQYYTHCPSFSANDVEINVQGTSSQKYPRRNFKAKFKKAKNWIYTQGELAGQPVSNAYTLAAGQSLSANWHEDHETIGSNTFTWKIDYMESSGSYNTGFANLMGSGVYDKHPLEDLHLSGVDASEFRTSVYGFPCLVFHKTGENDYTYIGRYNFNLDKSSNERYGFELKKEQPNLMWQKEVAVMDGDEPVLDPETGNPMTEIVNYRPTIKDVAECWELRDNQGTWCSWRFPNAEMRSLGFKAPMSNSTAAETRYEVAQHFEARYNVDADPFEFAQNIVLGKEADDPDGSLAAAIGGNTPSIASEYVYNKMSNLERLFKWLDSTDTNAASNTTLSPSKTFLVSAKLTKKEANPNFDYNEYILDPDNYAEPEFIYVDDVEAMVENGVTYTVENNRLYGTFTKDSKEYRRQKFFAEFEQHLDLHYCCIYFVMTELMLCYDSRGKNMMIASWGPRESGGDYIWYPIFYDIDTQLGLNNVGAKLWDYDEDSSERGTFSTKDSVLWTNLYDVFKNNVMSTYRTLRNGKINESIIENAYMCRAGSTFNSYAMMGKRPIIALGLDEHYKYVLPVTVPWKDQTGQPTTANYLYACQGDRILSRELLIENRLLYMDSKWLGGTFTISSGGMAGISFRSTGNKPSTSSDIYLNGKRYDAVARQYVDDPTIVYPVPYFDATAEYYVTPYLNFYVTTFVDENTFQTKEAYNEGKYPNGIPTDPSPSVVEGYRSGQVDQQLNYFAGSSYISSVGDLSLKYLNEVHFPNTPRLLDISIGSDVPGYFNSEVPDPFDLCTEVNSDGTVKSGHEKSLLQKINLTHLRNLNKYLDVRSPDKLEEFRALDTKLTYALFADGAPLNTVHLPETVTRLVFNQNKELKKLITSEPVVATLEDGVLTYRPHEEYEGLYVKNVTDYVSSMDGQGSPIIELSFDGDALGYGSYTILKNVVFEKNGTNNRLSIRMADVNWTPYVQVEYGETKQSGVNYFYLTDHSDYEPYNHLEGDWLTDTLNGRVYTKDETIDESVITDLSLLDLFVEDYRLAEIGNRINYFTNNIESAQSQRSYPTISGELYVSNANGTPVDEFALTDVYGVRWPNLKIRAAKIDKAYVAKYVQRINGKDNELDILRSAKEVGAHPRFTAKIPTLANHDFVGWTLYPEYSIIPQSEIESLVQEGKILQQSDIVNMEFDAEHDSYIFYTVFTITQFAANFYNPDGTLLYTTNVNYGSYLSDPPILPSTDESSLELDMKYRFLGWVFEPENPMETCFPKSINLAPNLATLNRIKSQTADKNFYACYIAENVHAKATDNSYFTFTRIYATDFNAEGYSISPKSGIVMNGKITIPATYNGLPVVELSNFTGGNPREGGVVKEQHITHIFFENNENITSIGYECFDRQQRTINGGNVSASNPNLALDLQYIELPVNLKKINTSAFRGQSNLQYFDLPEGLLEIGQYAFQGAFETQLLSRPLYIPGTVRMIEPRAFAFLGTQSTELQIGSVNSPSKLRFDLIQQNLVQENSQAATKAYTPFNEWIFGNNPNTTVQGGVIDIIKVDIYDPISDYAIYGQSDFNWDQTLNWILLRHSQYELELNICNTV